MIKMERLAGVVLLTIVWWLITALGLVNPLFIPKISVVFITFLHELNQGILIHHLLATLWRAMNAFALAIMMGVTAGLVFGYFSRLYRSVEIVVDFFRSIPGFALYPLFLVFFGLGDPAKIAIAAWVASLTILINTVYGVRNCREQRILAARAMKANNWQILFKIILPEAAPSIAAGLRIGISQVLVVTIGAEMFLGTDRGLGQYIYNAGLVYNIGKMFAGIILAGLLGYICNQVFFHIETRLIHWRGR